LLRTLPEFRGRDRMVSFVLGASLPPDGLHDCVFGPGLRFRVRYRDDGSLGALFFLQYESPALAPVLDAVLKPGHTFFDVGANIGVYTGWAARRVEPGGRVHAFEPVPATGDALSEFVTGNGLTNVLVVPKAVGARTGTVAIHVVPRASGLASAVAARPGTSSSVSAPLITLDDYVKEQGGRIPDLVKVDVEGYEFEVLQGARQILAGARSPVVLFESDSRLLAEGRVSFGEIVRWLDAEVGYRCFALLPRGLDPIMPTEDEPRSGNTLALHPERHGEVVARLRRCRFRRNQTC